MQTKSPDLETYFDGTHFFNPGERPQRRSLTAILKWRLTQRRVAWPVNITDPIYPAPPSPAAGQVVVTFIGHASFLIQAPGLTILTDPIFSERCSPLRWVGPKRVRKPGLALADLPKIDLILLSHNHYDHADLPSLRALAATGCTRAVTLAGVAPLLRHAGIHHVDELHWWQTTQLPGARITATPARHFSRRGLRDLNKTLWGGLMVDLPDFRLLFAGDSGAGDHWQTIHARLGAPDLALLPIGAYDPRFIMAPVHMNPEEAVDAHLALRAGASLGMHFGTFRLTDEPIDEPAERLRAACSRSGVGNFDVLGFGESRVFQGGQG